MAIHIKSLEANMLSQHAYSKIYELFTKGVVDGIGGR